MITISSDSILWKGYSGILPKNLFQYYELIEEWDQKEFDVISEKTGKIRRFKLVESGRYISYQNSIIIIEVK